MLPRLVGMKKAMEMILTGAPVPAEEALRLGMINRVCPADGLLDASLEMARSLARGPVKAMGVAKRTVHEAWESDLHATLDTECRRQARLMTQPDFVNAVRAFFRKERPTFT